MAKAMWSDDKNKVINPNWSDTKKEYAAMERSYCDSCGNSDADMDIDDIICYDCLHPEEAKRNAAIERQEYLYVYGDNSMDY